MKIFSTSLFFFLFIIGMLSSCGTGEIKNVSFEHDVLPVLEKNCFECHASENPIGKINLQTYKNVMSAKYFNHTDPVTISGKPELSRLYIVVHSNNDAVRMPPARLGYDKLDEEDILIIKTWIQEGAKNN